jgi:hypothetical protein
VEEGGKEGVGIEARTPENALVSGKMPRKPTMSEGESLPSEGITK